MSVEKLTKAIEGCQDENYVLSGFSEGFRLGLKEQVNLKSKNRLVPASLPLMEKVNDEVKKNRIIGPFREPPFKTLHISPLHVIPKPGSTKKRMIFNLSFPNGFSVNDNIAENCKRVQYCSISDVAQYLLQHFASEPAWMAKVDLEDAYRIVPISQLDWKYLGICVSGKYYVDRMLPMGAASSCKIFQRVSDSLKEMFYKRIGKGAMVFNYLDDFLFIAESHENCEKALRQFELLCEDIGVPIASHKTVRPCTAITFLGLGIDAKNLTLFIPKEKIAKTEEKLNKFLSLDRPRVKEWQSIAGTLSHLSQVVSSGRIYLSSIYERLTGILSQKQHVRRSITTETRNDIEVWLYLLQVAPGRQFKVFNQETGTRSPLITDASTSVGFGAVWGEQWFYGRWPENKSANIAVLELYPIFLALSLSTVKDTAISVQTDNKALVSVLNNLYSKDVGLRTLMRPIVRMCMCRNIRLIASHIPGKDNTGPDLLSRGEILKFRQRFPHMAQDPVKINPSLSPEECGWIKWSK